LRLVLTRARVRQVVLLKEPVVGVESGEYVEHPGFVRNILIRDAKVYILGLRFFCKSNHKYFNGWRSRARS